MEDSERVVEIGGVSNVVESTTQASYAGHSPEGFSDCEVFVAVRGRKPWTSECSRLG